MPDEPVVLKCEDSVATLVLNRPERLNAIHEPMRAALAQAFETVEQDRRIRVAVLTGAGRAFSAGGDLKGLMELKTEFHSEQLRSFLEGGHELIRQMRRMSKPIVASVNGPAAGAGMNLALACDLRIASDRATFAQSFVKVGLHPDYGGTYFLPRFIGIGRAIEMFFLGEPIDAAEALRLGLVNRVVPHDQLEQETRALAGRLAEAPPMPLALLKKALYEWQDTDLDLAMRREVEAQMKCYESGDSTEGLKAFLEKRKPRFRGA